MQTAEKEKGVRYKREKRERRDEREMNCGLIITDYESIRRELKGELAKKPYSKIFEEV